MRAAPTTGSLIRALRQRWRRCQSVVGKHPHDHVNVTGLGAPDQDSGQTKVSGFKWTSNTRVFVGIIAALLLTIWLGLRLQYY